MPVSMMVPLKVRWLTMAAQSRGSAKGMERSICERSVSLPDAFCPLHPVRPGKFEAVADGESMQSWLDAHTPVFDVLSQHVTSVAESAGMAGRAAERHAPDSEVQDALARSGEAAARLLAEVVKARALPPIPDQDTARHFTAGLARWADAAETISFASGQKDAAEIMRGGNALEAGTDEFLRSAAALRKATGQAPDPRNPLS
jgi:hypothetical protein